MSDFDDFRIEEYWDEYDTYNYKIPTAADSGVWTTKEGEHILVKDMTEWHLENAIKYIKKHDKEDWFISWLYVLEKELARRKESAF